MTSRTTSLTSTGWNAVLFFSQQRAQPVDDGAGAPVVPDDVLERRAQLHLVQRLASEEMPGRLRVAAHGGERLTQLVRQRAGELSERRHAAQVRELAPLRVGVDLSALAIGDVLDDAQDLVAVTTDDARFVEAFGILRAHHVFELLGLVRRC